MQTAAVKAKANKAIDKSFNKIEDYQEKLSKHIANAKKMVPRKIPQKILMLSGGTILLVIAANQIKRWYSNYPEGKVYDKDTIKSELSFPQSQYRIFADTIQLATSTMNDDEPAIFNVFSQLNTNSDVLQLIKAFGRRTYWAGIGFLYNASITEALHAKLDQSEISKINQILSAKNITIII